MMSVLIYLVFAVRYWQHWTSRRKFSVGKICYTAGVNNGDLY